MHYSLVSRFWKYNRYSKKSFSSTLHRKNEEEDGIWEFQLFISMQFTRWYFSCSATAFVSSVTWFDLSGSKVNDHLVIDHSLIKGGIVLLSSLVLNAPAYHRAWVKLRLSVKQITMYMNYDINGEATTKYFIQKYINHRLRIWFIKPQFMMYWNWLRYSFECENHFKDISSRQSLILI